MCALRFPQGAIDILNYDGPDSSQCTTLWPKWLIYALDSAPRDAHKLFSKVMDAVLSAEMEDFDRELQSYLKPAPQDFPAPDLQAVLDHYFSMLGEMNNKHVATGEWDWEVFPFGFIVITGADWREKGVAAVHCWEERRKWKVLQCHGIPVNNLRSLESVAQLDSSFDDLVYEYDGSNNDGPDNQGGAAPVGEWQFVVFCISPSKRMGLQYGAELAITDPRSEATYDPGDACLCFLHDDLSAERVNENRPLAYPKLVKNPTPYPSVCKRHPSLFVHIPNDLANIEIVNMDWDHDIARSDEELMGIGRESKVTTQKCDADSLVRTLQQLAGNA